MSGAPSPSGSMPAGESGTDAAYSGMQYKMQLNVDYLPQHRGSTTSGIPPTDTIGLFLALAAGDLTTSGAPSSPWHAWLTLGVRGNWDVGR